MQTFVTVMCACNDREHKHLSSFLGQAALVWMWAAADMANIRQVYVHTDRVSLHCEHDTNFILHKDSKQDGLKNCKDYRWNASTHWHCSICAHMHCRTHWQFYIFGLNSLTIIHDAVQAEIWIALGQISRQFSASMKLPLMPKVTGSPNKCISTLWPVKPKLLVPRSKTWDSVQCQHQTFDRPLTGAEQAICLQPECESAWQLLWSAVLILEGIRGAAHAEHCWQALKLQCCLWQFNRAAAAQQLLSHAG